ncbi:DNA repair protein rhp57 [Coemansia asiatica]|uniref:DNA repair protein rhp57 n=1 Tax=Coemansia asiatica TaxID=1052880 RepID=A0A9W7XLF5_9FUNG|nr:DNA repair protein rhp57 [Coemansia asiatica]KAJ2884489.1 DNA repair protein rhp57 [Coemansia asiatica]
MNEISASDQALLDKCKAKLGCTQYHQCLLVPLAELQRAAGLTDSQAQHARQLLSITTYPWQENIKAASALRTKDKFISTGDPLIDCCFGGSGVRQRSITEIVGESASGKTQLCLQLTISALLESPETNVIYISTEGAFPTGRLASMLAARCSESSVQRAMQRVQVAEFEDMETMFHAMEYKLPALMSSGSVRLVVVDSIAAHLRFGSGEVSGQMQFYKHRSAKLVALGAKLKLWATKYQCAIVCTNQVKDIISEDAGPLLAAKSSTDGGVDDEVEDGDAGLAFSSGGGRKAPALGSMWANIIDARIMMYQRRGMVLPEGLPEGFQPLLGPLNTAEQPSALGAAAAGSQVDPPRHLMRTRRWLENAFSPWAPHAQCEVFLDESGFHHI